MKPDGPIKLVSQLLDLPLLDSDGRYCGIVDDIEFSGSPGKAAEIKALLVGPGAYKGRMPGWSMPVVRLIAGDRVTRVPIERIEKIEGAVYLNGAANAFGLEKSENAAARWLPRRWAL
jgi:sporulation protein YlmC with PRC-barrel domain